MHQPKFLASTADVRLRRFQAHGRIDYGRDGNIVMASACGPFNAEIVPAMAATMRGFMADLNGGGIWGVLVTVTDSALASPGALAGLADYLQTRATLGHTPAATAFVIGADVEGNQVMGQHYRRCYWEAGMEFAIFADVAPAKAWLQQFLTVAH